MGPQAGLDVSDRNACFKPRQGSSKRTRRIALDYEKFRRRAQLAPQCSGHGGNVEVRVLLARTAEIQAWKMAEAVFAWLKSRMLPRANQRRRQAKRRQRTGNRFQLDGFGPGPNDQINAGGTQPSPLLGRRTVAPLRSYLNGNCRRRLEA